MKRLIKKRVFFLLCSGLLCCIIYFASCLDEIRLEAPPTDPSSIAIRGIVMAADTPRVVVEISKLTNYRAFELPEPVVGATVVLMDDEDHRVEVPMQEDGRYTLILAGNTYDLEPAPGRSYQLSVLTPEGKSYLSTMETLYPAPIPTAVDRVKVVHETLNSVGNIVRKDYFRFLINTPIVNPGGGGKAYLKWRFTGVYQFTESAFFPESTPPIRKTCYYYETPNALNLAIFNGVESTEPVLPEFPLYDELIDYRFREGYYLTVYQQSLSSGAYHYWEKIQDLLDLSAGVYDPPPGKIKGNIHNVDDESEEVFGYFYATQEVVIRLLIPPGEGPKNSYCPNAINFDNVEQTDRLCFNCLLRLNSTLEKPDYW